MRVAFTLIGGAGWTGGINYLENLLSALAEQPACNVQPVLFAGTKTDSKVLARLAPYLVEPPILSPVWDESKVMRIARLALGFGLQCDFLAKREFKRANIDVVFQHAAWYGCLFGMPTLAWIADFQHRRLPSMFSKFNFYWRDVGYWALSHCATRLMVSSQDAQRDCERFYPKSAGRVDAVPFAVRMGPSVDLDKLREIQAQHNLPEKFFFLPNQFWKHKNHLSVVDAMRILNSSGSGVTVVASGAPLDGRNPEHPQQVLDKIKTHGLQDRFIVLGLIPFAHILPLMRLSAAVVNPSFFEGWSTTVEEAKAVGAPLLLSDIPIHREQTLGRAAYFDAGSPAEIAAVLSSSWSSFTQGPRLEVELLARQTNQEQRNQFARAFGSLVVRTFAQR